MKKKMQCNKRVHATSIMAFLVFSMVLAYMPTANAAGAITLTPTTQVPGASVTVSGTGFGANQAVGIGFGAEVNGSDCNMTYTGTGMGPYRGTVSHWPIKPGSFVLYSDIGMIPVSTYTDNGNGRTIWSRDGSLMGTINYTTGEWSRSATSDVSGIVTNYTATYTHYAYNVTPAAGVTTNPSGAFTASITVPTVADENYVVTAVDTAGNKATATLNVVPESLTLGVMVLLSTVAVIVSILYFRKRPKIVLTQHCFSPTAVVIEFCHSPLIMAFLAFSMVLACIPMANAAGSITLTPTTQIPGGSVTVLGSGFGVQKPVGIGFGAEVKVINETISITVSGGTGPHTGYASHLPIKPGTFTDAANQSSTSWMIVGRDAGNGTVTGPPVFVNSTINYVTGQYTRFTTTPPTAYYQHLCNYTYYQYNVTPAAGVTTNALGNFQTTITVPSVYNGNYDVTAIDTEGHIATATLNAVPEGLTVGVMVLLSTVAVIVSIRYFRKRQKIENCSQVKL